MLDIWCISFQCLESRGSFTSEFFWQNKNWEGLATFRPKHWCFLRCCGSISITDINWYEGCFRLSILCWLSIQRFLWFLTESLHRVWGRDSRLQFYCWRALASGRAIRSEMLRVLKHFEWPRIWCYCIDCQNQWRLDSGARIGNSGQRISHTHSINFWGIACKSTNSVWGCLVIFDLRWGNFWRCYARSIHLGTNR